MATAYNPFQFGPLLIKASGIDPHSVLLFTLGMGDSQEVTAPADSVVAGGIFKIAVDTNGILSLACTGPCQTSGTITEVGFYPKDGFTEVQANGASAVDNPLGGFYRSAYRPGGSYVNASPFATLWPPASESEHDLNGYAFNVGSIYVAANTTGTVMTFPALVYYNTPPPPPKFWTDLYGCAED